MNKKSVVKISLTGLVLIGLVALMVIALNSQTSYAQLEKQVYTLGEKIKININEESSLKISTPSNVYRQVASGNLVFTPEETGRYSVEIVSQNKKENYDFEVISDTSNKNNSKGIEETVKVQHQKIETSDIQEKAEINKPVKWKKASGEKYETKAPRAEERKLSRLKKQIKISSEEHYENVLAYSSVEELVRVENKDKIKIYWQEEKRYLDFDAKDENSNGLIDKVEWNVPHLSNQTFEIIIIIKAAYLDNNKTFISDIYDSVKSLDNVWSPVIKEGEYVQVQFEQSLDSENDITVFPRIISGNPKIEVYEKDKIEKIAEFSEIKSSEYNRVLLTNLIGEQDSFDLKIIGGSLEIDYIVDPSIFIRTGIATTTAANPGATVTFNTPVPSTSYSILLSGGADTDTMYSMNSNSIATTGFTITSYDDSGALEASTAITPNQYIAIGKGDFIFNEIKIECGDGLTSGATINLASNFSDTNYAVVASPLVDDDQPTINFVAASKAVGSFGIDVEDDTGVNEAIIGGSYCVFSHGEYSLGSNQIKAGSTTTAAAGDTTVNFGTAFPSANYVVVAMAQAVNGALCSPEIVSKSTGNFVIHFEDDAGTNCASKNFDWASIMQEGFTHSNETSLVIDSSNSPYLFCGEVNSHTFINISSTGTAHICQYTGQGTGYANISLGNNGVFILEAGGSINGIGRGTDGGAGRVTNGACATQGTDGGTLSVGIQACTSNGGGGGGGNRGGTGGDSTGGAGGGFGGIGGVGGYSVAGIKGTGGNTYGISTSQELKIGSGGGGQSGDLTAGTGPGARGGAGLKIDSGNGNISIYGAIDVSGNKGTNGDATDDSGGGGGSGGHVVLKGKILDLTSGVITANGGAGGDAAGISTSDSCGGGGGGGGRILYVGEIIYLNGLTNSVSGGAKGIGTDASCDQDADAGTSTAGASGTIYREDKPPIVNIITPQNKSYSLRELPLNFNVSLNENGSVKYSLDGGITNRTMYQESSIFGIYFNHTNNSIVDGSYIFNAYANDTAGTENNTASITFSIDTAAPEIAIASPENQGNYSQNSISFNIATNQEAECLYSLNAGLTNLTMNSNSSKTGFDAINSSISDGIYNVKFYCNDSVNNLGVNESNFKIDSLPPIITIAVPEEKNYSFNEIELNFSVQDSISEVDRCWYSFDFGENNISLANCQNTSFIALQEDNLLILYANDSLGNENSANISFFVDSINPLINFIAPTPLNNSKREFDWIKIYVSIIDEHFKEIIFELYNDTGGLTLVNRSSYPSLVTEINWTGLNNDFVNYFYNATVIDVSGNTNSTETRTIQLTPGDISPPDIYFIMPPANNYFYNSISINFSVYLSETGNSVWYNINNSLSNYSMSSLDDINYNATNSSIADGHYSLSIYANDSLDNIGIRNRNFSVDSSPALIEYGLGTEINEANKSQNWIYINVSITEENELEINFSLYNPTGLINLSSFSDKQKTINWTNLPEGIYFYNISVLDRAGNLNFSETRKINLDSTIPLIELLTPEDSIYSNSSILNLTCYAEDDIHVSSLTLLVYNETGLINQTFIEVSEESLIFGIIYTFPYEGLFKWNYQVRDSAGNLNRTENNTVTIDTTYPSIGYSLGTEDNASEFEREWIYINVSVEEANPVNITFNLFNLTDLINSTTFSMIDRYSNNSINFTNLPSLNLSYLYNVSVLDKAGNLNFSETRTIRLIDITPPQLNLVKPVNRTYYENESLQLDFTVIDLHLDSCWYVLDSSESIHLPGCLQTLFNVSEGSHTLYLFANDSLGLISTKNSTFIANESLLPKRKGILTYGEGAIQLPRYRLWDGKAFSSELNASSVGGPIEWIGVKSNPVRDENILITADAGDDVNIQVNSTLNNLGCWHNGIACGGVLELTAASSTINRQKADVAYETLNGDAIAIFSQGNSTPAYVVWNGTGFSQVVAIPQTQITGGVISYLKLAAHPFKDEIALIMTNTTALNIIVWNGSSWGCEPFSLRSTTLTPDVYQHADIAYEQSSGDLLVVSTVDVQTDIDYTTKSDGVCTYTTTRYTAPTREAEIISLSPRFGSNHIILSSFDITNNQFTQGFIWNGTEFLTASGVDITSYTEASPFIPIAASWAGTSNFGFVAYSDAATSLNLDYFRYNISTNAWEGGTTGLDASGLTSFSDEEQNIRAYSFIGVNKSLFVIQDDLDDLWAKVYDAETQSWSEPDNGVALETTVSSTSFPSFDFYFAYDIAGPEIIINSPKVYENSTSILINITTGEDSVICRYKIDEQDLTQLNMLNSKSFFSIEEAVSEDVHELTINCVDKWENSRSSTKNFTIDTTYPSIEYSLGTENNASEFEREWIYINVSVEEANPVNITFNLFNLTDLINSTTFSMIDKYSNSSINFTLLEQGVYYYNVSIIDAINYWNSTETRIINLTRTPPVVTLLYPLDSSNFSSYLINHLNFSVSDSSPILNCSLWGNWTGIWSINQTLNNPDRNKEINFSLVAVSQDGFYSWNVDCIDIYGVQSRNPTNFTFAAFNFPEAPNIVSFNISQERKDGSGSVFLSWEISNHSYYYKIYYNESLTGNFSLLNITFTPNYVDLTSNQSKRRFYQISSWNPSGENKSTGSFGKTVYSLSRKEGVNTRNWVGFYLNSSLIKDANSSLYEILNATSLIMWNETSQKRVACNLFSCPESPGCTESNCNFEISQGRGYEVTVDSNAPLQVNWSLVGVPTNKINMSLVKPLNNFGKNWISINPNTTLINAKSLIGNISSADAVSEWNSLEQKSSGLIRSPFIPGQFIGSNFAIDFEKAYEVSVTSSLNWSQP